MDLSIKQKDVKKMDFEQLPSSKKLFKGTINIFMLNKEKIALPDYKSRCFFSFVMQSWMK